MRPAAEADSTGEGVIDTLVKKGVLDPPGRHRQSRQFGVGISSPSAK